MDDRDEYRQVQSRVIELLQSILPLVRDIYLNGAGGDAALTTHYEEVLAARIESLQDNQFVVVVVGEIKRGKSTLLNALLGDEVFATDVTEATATVGFLKHNSAAPKPDHRGRAVVYYRDERPPEVIETSELGDFTTRQSAQGPDVVAKKIDHVDVFAESAFVEDGVTLVDTPGVNSIHSDHLRMTYEQIDKSHAALFLLNAGAAFTQADKTFLTDIKGKIERFFFLVNRIDQTAVSDHPRVLDHVRKELANLLGREVADRAGVYGISALQALLGRHGYVEPNPIIPPARRRELEEKELRRQLLVESAIEPFEQALLRYLFKGEKTRDLLVSSLRYASDLLKGCERYLKEQEAVLEGTLEIDELNRRQEDLERQIERQKSELDATSMKLISKLSKAVDEAVEEINGDLANAKNSLEDSLAGYISIEAVQDNWDEGEKLATLPYRKLEQIRVRGDRLLTDRIKSVIHAEDRRLRGRLSEVVEGVVQFKLPELSAIEITLRPVSSPQAAEELEDLRSSIEEYEGKVAELEKGSVPEAKEELERKRRELDNARQNLLVEKQIHGVRPAVERHEYQVEEKRFRGGLWGVLKWMVKGQDDVLVPRIEIDDSAQAEYDRKIALIERRGAEKEKEIITRIQELKDTWDETRRRNKEAEQIRRLRDQKEKKLAELQALRQKERGQARKRALDQAKRSLTSVFDEQRASLLEQLESMVSHNKDIVVSFVETITEEIDEVMRQLESELDHLKELRAKKGLEREVALKRLSRLRDDLEVVAEREEDLRVDLRLIFPDKVAVAEGVGEGSQL